MPYILTAVACLPVAATLASGWADLGLAPAATFAALELAKVLIVLGWAGLAAGALLFALSMEVEDVEAPPLDRRPPTDEELETVARLRECFGAGTPSSPRRRWPCS